MTNLATGKAFTRRDFGRGLAAILAALLPVGCLAVTLFGGRSVPVPVDLSEGPRMAARTETLTYSTLWSGDAPSDARAVITIDCERFSAEAGSGVVSWTPTRNGTHALTHTVIAGGEQVGETLTATFSVSHFPDIAFTAGDYAGAYDGAGHGISVNVTDPASSAVVTYSLAEDGEYSAEMPLVTNVTDGVRNVYFRITADGYSPTNGVSKLKITPAKMAADGDEPGEGVVSEGGLSKFDARATYDGIGHTIDANALAKVKLLDPITISYSLKSNGVYQTEPILFTNACVTSIWYKISAANYGDFVHEARVTILQRKYGVTFDLGMYGSRVGGGERMQSVEQDAAAVAPDVEADLGRMFIGWDKAFDCVQGDLVVTAQYEAVEYSIAYVDTKGCANTNPATYTVEDDEIVFSPLTAPAGWKFLGWSPASIAKGSTGNKTVTAQWEEQGGGDTPERPPVNPPEVQSHAVTFDLGAHGTRTGGGALVQSVKHGWAAVAPTVDAAAGYSFAGWDKAFDYVVGAMMVAARYETIPYAIAYVLDGGANAAANPESYTVEDAVTLAAPTRDGYVFAGWTPNGGTIAKGSTGDRTFAASWEKVRNEVVGEVDPLEAGTFVATTYDGYLYDEEDGVVVGTIQVKAAKAKKDKKTGGMTTALTVTIQLAGEAKKISAKGSYDLGLDAEQSFAVKGCGDLVLLLGTNGMAGSFGDWLFEGVPNVFAAKDADSKAKAAEADAAYVGTYNLIADEGSFVVTVAKKGKVKVSGKTAAGKSVGVSTQLIVGDGVSCIPVMAPKAGLAFAVWLGEEAEVAGLTDAVLGQAGTLPSGATFNIDADALAELVGDGTYADYFPCGMPVGQVKAKWVVAPDGKGKAAKAGKVVVDKKTGEVDESKLGENPSALTLAYTANTGAFKGSFKAYVNSRGVPKAVTVSVSGVMVGDCGYGTATVRKGSVPIVVGRAE